MGALDAMMLEEACRILRDGQGGASASATPTVPALTVQVGEHVLATTLPAGGTGLTAGSASHGRPVASGHALTVDEGPAGWVISRRLQAGAGDFRLALHPPVDGEAGVPDAVARLLRASVPVEECLAAYLSPDAAACGSDWTRTPAAATAALDHARCLSEHLVSALLFDREGLVHSVSGRQADSEDLAAVAARLARQAAQLFSAWKLVTPERLWFASAEQTTLLACLPGTDLTLLLRSTGGDVARGLAETAYRMLCRTLGVQSATAPAEATAGPSATSLRRRYSWFQPPVLLPMRPFVSKRNSGVFHVPHCRRLATAVERRLDWYASRADALRSSLRPCQACKP